MSNIFLTLKAFAQSIINLHLQTCFLKGKRSISDPALNCPEICKSDWSLC